MKIISSRELLISTNMLIAVLFISMAASAPVRDVVQIGDEYSINVVRVDSFGMGNDDDTALDIPGTAIEAGAFATLVAALNAADLVGAISSPNGPFTVFAPTDNAFAALPDGLVGCLLEEENQPVLTKILLYHVVRGQVLSSDLVDGMEAPTLEGDFVTVGVNGGVTINNSTVVTADVLATNGVIHIINQVLVPPSIDIPTFLSTCDTSGTVPVTVDGVVGVTEVGCRTIHDVLVDVGAGEFSSLLVKRLIDFKYGEFTVFAPLDRIVNADRASLLIDGYNLTTINDVLLFHIAANTIEDDIRDPSSCGKSLIMLNEDMTTNQESSTTECVGIEVLQVGPGNSASRPAPKIVGNAIRACNGVIYTIEDALMLPTLPNITDFSDDNDTGLDILGTAVDAGLFDTLIAALDAVDLAGALTESNGPFTVFAPTDDAFASLPDGLVTCLLEEENKGVLSSILLYHVVRGAVLSTDLMDGMEAPTLEGDFVTVDLTDDVMINNSTVLVVDVLANNGVIHIINQVLVPPSIDIPTFLSTCDTSDAAPSQSMPSTDLSPGATPAQSPVPGEPPIPPFQMPTLEVGGEEDDSGGNYLICLNQSLVIAVSTLFLFSFF